MRVGALIVAASLLVPTSSWAGGLFLPGSGATSTSRAGAAVASADDGEALSINPAGLAKTEGWTITVSLAFIRYFMEFSRRGSYDATPTMAPYEGTPFPTVENDPAPPLGIGKFQPIPVIAVVSDLNGAVPNLRVAAGIYAPSGYPFRNMTAGYKFPRLDDPDANTDAAPPPTRYDILEQESRLLLPSLAASYRILPELDIGARFTAGNVQSKSTVAVWGTPFNVVERPGDDSLFSTEVKDGFIPAFGLGLTYRPTPAIEIGANYSSAIVIKAKGTATSAKGVNVSPVRVIGPLPDDMTSCDTGGTFEQQKACVNLQLPQTATIGARYKFIGANEQLRGDIELDAQWENWGKRCELRSSTDAENPGGFVDPECTAPGQYRVVIDSGLYVNDTFQEPLRKNLVNYGLQDTFSVRLGGSYHLPLGPAIDENKIILRGGVAYDTAAAKTGWLRASFDGAARLTSTLGAAYRTSRWELTAGGGFVYEGRNTNPGASADGSDCNPTAAAGTAGCAGTNQDRPVEERQGPDPTNPLIEPAFQAESPYNQGSIKSHYVLLTLGFSTWF